MTEFEIQLEETETKGRFFVEVENGEGAQMTFSKAGSNMIIIDHTEVPDAFRGTGLGVKLVEYGVKLARQRKIKILPLCPFAAAQFRRHSEWADVLN